LFIRAADQNQVIRTNETIVRILHTPEPETMFSLSDFALMLMLWNQSENPDWEQVVRERVSIAAEEMRTHLLTGSKWALFGTSLNSSQTPSPISFRHRDNSFLCAATLFK
jgi:hypothetical protein